MPAEVVLPDHDGYVDDQTIQWWYWNGHLRASDGRRLSFVLVFFAGDFVANVVGLQMMHCAVTDESNGAFHSRVSFVPGLPEKTPGRFDLASLRRSMRASGAGGSDRLFARVGGYELDLHVQTDAAPTLHYGGLRHHYAFGGDTIYYARKRMEATGSLRVNGEHLDVDGTAWFDRQYGKLAEAVVAGWQWFAIQLDDGSDLMVFDFPRYAEEGYGSIVAPDGVDTWLNPGDFELEILDRWRSPRTLSLYPAKWRIRVGDHDLVVEPVLADQEIARLWEYPHYWEGACRVSGTSSGRAYVELVGYSEPLHTFGRFIGSLFPLRWGSAGSSAASR